MGGRIVRAADTWIQRNGMGILVIDAAVAGTSIAIPQIVSTLVELAVNDYVELMTYQTTGPPLNVNAASPYSPELSLAYVGAAA